MCACLCVLCVCECVCMRMSVCVCVSQCVLYSLVPLPSLSQSGVPCCKLVCTQRHSCLCDRQKSTVCTYSTD